MRLLAALGLAAILADATTTWVALSGGGYREATPASAQLIGTLGLTLGVAASALIRLTALGGALLAGRRLLPPRWQPAVLGVLAVAVALTWLIVAENVMWLT